MRVAEAAWAAVEGRVGRASRARDAGEARGGEVAAGEVAAGEVGAGEVGRRGLRGVSHSGSAGWQGLACAGVN